MAVSGSKNYSITAVNIIESALRKIGEFDAGETVPGDETETALMSLNLMTKEWTARGIDIWLRDEVTLFLQPDQKSYVFGTDNATRSYVETTISVAEVTGQTAISVTSSAGMTAADFVGIKVDDNTIHWSTIASVDSATEITINDALDDDAAVGNKVYAYTTKVGKPNKILSAYRRDTSDIDTQIDIIGENEYYEQSNKGSDGPPVQVWYQPLLSTGELFVWPVDGGKSVDKIVISGQFHADDFDTTADNPEFPIEWGNALVWNLAAELAPEYGIPEREQAKLFQIAEFKLEKMLDYDQENASVIFAFASE